MDYPSISIVTVVFNDAHNIEKTIRSIIDLTYPRIEYIIIDGGSTDGTVEIIKKYQEKIHFWVSEPDRGIYDAMNKGVMFARGEWINFMNSGDHFASADALSFFTDLPADPDIIFGDARIVYPGFQTLWRKSPLTQMWKRMPFCHQASFTKRDILRSHPFDMKYRLSSDYKFVYECYLRGARFLYVDLLICIFDFKEGASIRLQNLSLSERRQIVLSSNFTIEKWLYYAFMRLYLKFSILIKNVMGKKVTIWATRLLRQ